MNVTSDAVITQQSRYHKKRPKKVNDLRSSATDDGATIEDEDGIVVTNEDIISPRKPTAQVITLVQTECSPRSKPSSKYNPSELLVVRPSCNRFLTFQSFGIPANKRSATCTNSIRTERKKFNITKPHRKNANKLCKLPLYRMKKELKRRLTTLEEKLSNIKQRNATRMLLEKTPETTVIKSPINLVGLFSKSKKQSRRQLSVREKVQEIAESNKALKRIEQTYSSRKERIQGNYGSGHGTGESSIPHKSPSQNGQEQGSQGKDSEQQKVKAPPVRISAKVKDKVALKKSKQQIKYDKIRKKSKKKNHKQKAHLRDFKQIIPIEGTNYTMEIILERELIDKTRAGNIDISKEPLHEVKANKVSDLRDEFTAYCGQKRYIKNWLFQV